MFYAIHKETKKKVNTILKEFSEDFMKNETWYITPSMIQSNETEIPNNEIEVKFRRGGKDIMNNRGTIYDITPHFYLLPRYNGKVVLKERSKEHELAEELIYNLILDNKLKFCLSSNKEDFVYNVERDLLDLEKIDIEVVIKSDNTKVADILIPFTEYNDVFGFGIIIEIQFSKQEQRLEDKRTFDRAVKGFSVCWLKKSDFEIVNNKIEFKKDYLNIEIMISIFERYADLRNEQFREMTRNFALMLKEKSDLLQQERENRLLLSECPKCKVGRLVKKRGGSGEFYGCSEYREGCKFTISI